MSGQGPAGPQFLTGPSSDDPADEALLEPPPRSRRLTWVVGTLVALLVVALGIRLATTHTSTTSDDASPSASGASALRAEPVLPAFPSVTPGAAKPSFRAIIPAIPGRPARTIAADDSLPSSVRTSCRTTPGCRSRTDLPPATLSALRSALPGAVLQFYATIVRRTSGPTTLVVRLMIATIRTESIRVTAEPTSTPRALDATERDLQIVQRVVGNAQIRVEAHGQVGSASPVVHLARLASDPRLLALN